MSGTRRRGLGWTIAIAISAATVAWAADGPLQTQARYKLAPPHVISDARGSPRLEHVTFGGKLKEVDLEPDLQLQGRWFVDASTSLGGEPFYSLEEQVAYFVAHAPGLVVRLPTLEHASPRIELATLELHLPF